MIALQQIYLSLNWSPIYWQTAVLTVNSGSKTAEEDGDKEKRDYGKTAKAIANLREQNITIATPLINSSYTDFSPDEENNRILFALKGIRSMNDEAVAKILNNRPYTSVEDFFERVAPRNDSQVRELTDNYFKEQGIKVKKTSEEYVKKASEFKETEKRLEKGQVIALIKSGAFKEFNEDSMTTMQKWVKYTTQLKTSLNGQNLSSAIRLGIFDTEDREELKLVYEMRSAIKKDKVKDTNGTSKDLVRTRSSQYKSLLTKLFSPSVVVDTVGEYSIIDINQFEKEYEKFKEQTDAILKQPETLQQFNIALFIENWNKVASGTPESWEMETIVFYSEKHELDYLDYGVYNVTPLNEIPKEPLVESTYMYRGVERANYKIFTIVGTVVDKNKDKGRFTMITPEGVITCKTYKGAFSHYDKQIKRDGKIVDKSWFTRGNRLMVWGYIKDDMFILKAPKNVHTIARIDSLDRDTGRAYLSLERESN